MHRILLLPLDERPCNYTFPAIMPKADFELIEPPKEYMGLKKRPADRDKLAEWVLEEGKRADACILSLDTLIYGGLIPSRLHHETKEELSARADLVKTLKAQNPSCKIYAFETIMRCPFYSLSDEEPDYYAACGAEIHLFGKYTHKQRLGILSEEEEKDFSRVKAKIPAEALQDYTARRALNLEVLFRTLDLVKEGTIDAFIVPQDDSAPYGFTAMDQQRIKTRIREMGLLLKVPVYPAADDTGMTMLCRAVNELNGVIPKIYLYYASAKGPFVTPCFEDRSIDATVKNQILAAGCRRVYSLPECDVMLAVNIGSEMLYLKSEEEMNAAYQIERSLPEYIDQIKYALSLGKLVAVADVAHPTQNDLELFKLLYDEDLLFKIHAYAGWNTSSNTLGTVICESCLYWNGRDDRGNRDFLLHRYFDDVGYCSHTRTWTDVNPVPANGCTVFVLDGERGKCVAAAREELLRYMKENFPKVAEKVEDVEMSSPWNRTFEMEIALKTKD